MKLLDRYIFREILGYTLVGVGVFGFVLMTPELLRLSELLARESMGPVQTAKLFLSVLPPKLVWALPLGVLVGLLMGVSRLAADRELMAFAGVRSGVGATAPACARFCLAGYTCDLGDHGWMGAGCCPHPAAIAGGIGRPPTVFRGSPPSF